LDGAPDYEFWGQEFESLRVRQSTILRDIAAEWRAIAVLGRRSPHEELVAGRFGLSRLGQDLGDSSWLYGVDISDFEKVEA
jgi:hypothetical protein